MSRPAWAPTCTCGETPLGYFCYPCHAWAGSSHGDQASWSRPRMEEVARDTAAAHTIDLDEAKRRVVQAIPTGVRCTNGRYAKRPPRQGEKVLPCGCPLGGAPRECIDAVATKTVTVKRRGLEH